MTPPPADAEKRLRPYVWVGVGLVLAGIELTVGGTVGADNQPIEVLGLTLIVIGSAFFVVNLVVIAWLIKHE
jgi:drug/metabolite transporter (DMT)-like permease